MIDIWHQVSYKCHFVSNIHSQFDGKSVKQLFLLKTKVL